MPRSLHFIAGLPRSGSTLLSAILAQNPRFHASMSGPLANVFAGLIHSMSATPEAAIFISDEQRLRVLRAVMEAFYSVMPHKETIFDTNRQWCAFVPAIATVSPSSRVICCVRSPAWILDSIERLVQRNCLRVDQLFGYDPLGTVYTRIEAMLKGRFLEGRIQALRQVWFSEHSNKLILVRYDSLTEDPARVLSTLYEVLQEEPFTHDFENVEYDAPEFDIPFGMPGLHRVKRQVRRISRNTILPPELFEQADQCFWDGNENPGDVMVL